MDLKEAVKICVDNGLTVVHENGLAIEISEGNHLISDMAKLKFSYNEKFNTFNEAWEVMLKWEVRLRDNYKDSCTPEELEILSVLPEEKRSIVLKKAANLNCSNLQGSNLKQWLNHLRNYVEGYK